MRANTDYFSHYFTGICTFLPPTVLLHTLCSSLLSAYMLEAHFAKPERTYFNTLGSYAGVIDHLESRGLNFRGIA